MTEKNRPMTTDHLIIRQSCWDDLEDFYRWERMPEVTEFFSIRDGQTKEDVIRKYLADEDDRQPASLLSCSKAKMILPAMVGTLRRPESRMGMPGKQTGMDRQGKRPHAISAA